MNKTCTKCLLCDIYICMKKFLLIITVFAFSGCINRIDNESGSMFGGATPWELQATSDEILKASTFEVKEPISEQENIGSMVKIIKVGLLLPLTGKASELGHAMQDAVMLSLWDQYAAIPQNNAIKIRIVVMPQDTKGTWDGSETAARKVLKEGADIILGPLYSNSVKAVKKIAKSQNVKMITFSNNKSVAGDGVFIMGFQPDEQIERVVEYATKRNKRKFASFTPNDKYGKIVRNAIKNKVDYLNKNNEELQSLDEIRSFEKRVKTITKNKLLIKNQITYSSKGSKYAKPVRELLNFDEKKFTKSEKLQAEATNKEIMEQAKVGVEIENAEEIINNVLEEEKDDVPFDTLIIPEGGHKLLDIASLLKYYHFDKEKIQLIGSGQWDNSNLLKSEILHNAWFATSSPDRKKTFYDHFYNKFKYKPKRLASLAYDAMALTVVLSFNGDLSEEALVNPAGFNAPVDGLFRFNKDGVAERKLAVLRVTPEGFVVIDKAPERFEIIENTEELEYMEEDFSRVN